jgi:hypothetical protein
MVVQKVVRTACPDTGYWNDNERVEALQRELEKGYSVAMCNTIQRRDGQQWLEYILEKEVIE